jgi:hypothetical protein
MAPILQIAIPTAQRAQAARRLPGMAPLDPADWLVVDDAYAAQMAERARLIADRPDAVHALLPQARPAAEELLAAVLDHLAARPDFAVAAAAVTRPDGVTVALDRDAPLMTLGRLTAEDFCLIEAQDGAHVLTGAILCFPAGWTLAEKIGRPLGRIHAPVEAYDDDIGKRVDRLFDGLKPGRPIWRANAHPYDDPTLFAPRTEARRDKYGGPASPYLRSERQCLLRLPATRAVVFSIHTAMARRG